MQNYQKNSRKTGDIGEQATAEFLVKNGIWRMNRAKMPGEVLYETFSNISRDASFFMKCGMKSILTVSADSVRKNILI